jgi:hypothetical protein
MSSITVGLISAGSVFTGALIGMELRRRLPSDHSSKDMQDLVRLSAGTVATLTALVLGLLVSSAKSSFDSINAAVVQSSAKFILLDRTLAHYGPESKAAREGLKQVLVAGIDEVWPAERTGVTALTALERANGIERVQETLRGLKPQNDAQRQVVAQAQQIANELSQSRWLVIEQAQTQLPTPLLVILVFWLALLFVSFGLFAPRNRAALVVLFIGACAISAAIGLVVEMNQPLEGLIKVSSAPMRNALRHIGQ